MNKNHSEATDANNVTNTSQIQVRKIDRLANELLTLENELNANIPTTLWISDLHGEGDRFKSILRGRFGLLFQTCREALPQTFSAEKIQYLTRIIRKSNYIEAPALSMDRQDVVYCLVQVLKYKLANINRRVEDIFHSEFHDTINRLLFDIPVANSVFEEEILCNRLISHLSYTIRQVLIDRIQVLGDVFDRGSQPDKIIRILASPAYRNIVDYVLGNHDILWMGAAAGNRSLIAEAIRITSRYDHFELMERMNFDWSKLIDFAERTYPDHKIAGKFKAKSSRGRAMEKALAIIQFKLEEQTIRLHPEYKMESRLWLNKLANMLNSGDTKGLNDIHFPTIDLSDPGKLTEEEQQVMDDLAAQFLSNKKFKRILNYFFSRGKTYNIHNNSLSIHALVPSVENGEFDVFLGKSGRELLDFIQETIKRVGQRYRNGEEQEESDQALFFYLWCGPKSPFFGKHAMKTFERYFLIDKETHTEKTLFWKQNLQTEAFKQKLKDEFDVKRVIFGHTPVDYLKGNQMASEDGVAINVDGGFAAAYYHRGHALVHTPYQLYGIILPTPDEIKNAESKLESAPLDIELIDEFRLPMKVKDTVEAIPLQKKRDQLMARIQELSQTNDN